MRIPLASPGFHWSVVPHLRDLLLGPAGIRLNEWLDNGQAEIVKHVQYRTIYRVQLPGVSFFLKHYPLSDVRSWLRQLVRPSKARGEFDKAQELARRGVATFTPLGLGERPAFLGPAESYLLSETLENTEPFDRFMELTWPTLPAAQRNRLGPRLSQELGEFLGRMHSAGVCHHDLHAGNLLVRLLPDDRATFFLIDLHAVSLRAPLNSNTSRDNLVVFNRWLSGRLSRSERLRCWMAYCETRRLESPRRTALPSRPGLAIELHRWPSRGHRRHYALLAGDIEERTLASRAQLGLNRDRRCLEDNRAFSRIRKHGLTGHVVADLDPALLESLLADPESPFRWPRTRILKHSASSTVAEIEVPGRPEQGCLIYKRVRGNTWKDAIANLFRPSPALRAWQAGHALLDRGLPTPRPLAVLHRSRGGLYGDGFLLFERIDHSQDLRQFVLALESCSRADRRLLLDRVIDRLARILRQMHDWNVSHRDLKAANILVQADPAGSGPVVWFIDLVGVVRYRHLPRQRRVQNLARLNASFLDVSSITRTDRLRFLRTYLRWGLAGKSDWKSWWRAVEIVTLKKIRHNERTGRPLK